MTFVDGDHDQSVASPGPGGSFCPRPYAIRAFRAQKLVALTISGFWSMATLARFAVEVRQAITELDWVDGEYTVCCDVSAAAIQGQDILSGFRELIVAGPIHASKLALWTTSPLSRMQSRRLLDSRPDIAVFDNEADAKRWLRS